MADEWYPGMFARQEAYGLDNPWAATPKGPVPEAYQLPAPENPGIVERSLPKVYDPLQKQQQEVGKAAFGMTGMGSLADLYDAYGSGDKIGMATAAATLIPAAKVGRGVAKVAEKLTGFAPTNPKLAAQAQELFGKYAHYADEYPPVGPPALMWKLPDPKKPGAFLKEAGGEVPYKTLDEATAKAAEPGFFLEKRLTPEAEQFQKDRNIIQRDMDMHGYQPYFDPSKRFDVNPKHYGPFEDTAITASPKTAAKQAEWDAKYGTDEIRARLQAGFKAGQSVPESDRWYLMGQLEQAYIKELGPKAGRTAFEKEFADMMAATTGGAAPYDNNLMAHYANFVNKRGERLPDAGWQLPFPIGGRFASGNLKQAQKYIDQGSVDWAENNAKRYDFSSAFKGNKNAGTIDEQMMTAFDPSLKDKQPIWYGPATKTLREEATKAGVDARGFQDVDWAGLKKLKTEAKGKTFDYEGPMINQINRSIETAHRLTGRPREEIVRLGVILKKIPMYAVPGLLGVEAASKMGGVAAQDSYEQ